MTDPKIIYAVEGPINPRSGARTLLPALGEPAEVKALRSQVEALKAALKPFAEFGANVDEHRWTSNIHREQISTWFGPSDFRRARTTLEKHP
jgi:hypothetical protein